MTPGMATAPLTSAQVFNSATSPAYVQTWLQGTPCCAKVRGSWIAKDGTDLLSLDLLDPFTGRASVPFAKARPCSGVDGGCFCAGERDALTAVSGAPVASNFEAVEDGGFCHARVVAPRDSLNFETFPNSEGGV